MKSSTPRARRKTAKPEIVDFSFASDVIRYAQKDDYVTSNLAFTIIALEFQPTRGFQGADRWAAAVSPSDGRPDEIITLTANPKRNTQLQAAKEHIDSKGPIPNVRLTKRGGTFYFAPAEPRGS